MNCCLGICYKETHDAEKATKAFQRSINQLEYEDAGCYYDKSQEAVAFIKELGGIPVEKESKKTSFNVF